MMPQNENSKQRQKIDNYTIIIIMFVAGSVILTLIPFLPGAPFVPMLISAGIASLAFKKPRIASGILSILVYVAFFWQINGFGIYRLLDGSSNNYNSLIAIVMYGFLLVPLLFSLFKKPIIAPLACMATALMTTPFYFLSIPIMGIAAFMSGLVGVSLLAVCFVLTLLPFLIIENVILISPTVVSNSPIVFSQLTNFSGNIPPLESLNLFSGDFPPPEYFSFLVQNDILGRLSNTEFLAIVNAVIIFAIIFIASAEISGAIHTSIKKIAKKSDASKWTAPLLVSIVLPIAFYLLITTFAQFGNYKTTLLTSFNDFIWMLTFSVSIGGIFVGRELLIQNMEKAEFTRVYIKEQILEAKNKLDLNKKIIAEITNTAPLFDLDEEKGKVTTNASLLDEIENKLPNAVFNNLKKWKPQLEKANSELTSNVESINAKLITELHSIKDFVPLCDAALIEAGVTPTFAVTESTGNSPAPTSIDATINEYKKVIEIVKKIIAELEEKYDSTTKAYRELMGEKAQEISSVKPTDLVKSNSITLAMKLVCIDYWRNFQISRKKSLEQKIEQLNEILQQLRMHDPRISKIQATLKSSKPSDTQQILENIRLLRSILAKEVKNNLDEDIRITSIISTMTSVSHNVLKFESTEQAAKLQSVYDELLTDQKDITKTVAVVESTVMALLAYSDAVERDKDSFIRIGQYPIAKRLIERTLKSADTITLEKMPFRKNATIIYFQIYESSPGLYSAKYLDEKEELRASKNYSEKERSVNV